MHNICCFQILDFLNSFPRNITASLCSVTDVWNDVLFLPTYHNKLRCNWGNFWRSLTLRMLNILSTRFCADCRSVVHGTSTSTWNIDKKRCVKICYSNWNAHTPLYVEDNCCNTHIKSITCKQWAISVEVYTSMYEVYG